MIKLYKKQDDKINVLKHIDQFLTSPDSRTHSTKQILLRLLSQNIQSKQNKKTFERQYNKGTNLYIINILEDKAKRVSKILIYEFFNVLSAYYLYCLNTIDRFIKFSAYDKKELSVRSIQCHYRFGIHYHYPSLPPY